MKNKKVDFASLSCVFIFSDLMLLFLYPVFLDGAFKLAYTQLTSVNVISQFILFLQLYVYARFLMDANFSNIKVKNVMTLFLIVGLICIFIFPIGSTDIFSYIGIAKEQRIYHLNPLFTWLSKVPGYNYASGYWANVPAVYGPAALFLFSKIPLFILKNEILNLLFLKLLSFLAFYISLRLLFRNSLNSKLVFLVALNPILIYEFIVNSHIDSLVFLLMTLSYVFLKNKKFLVSAIFCFISVLLKYYTIVLLPFYLIYFLKQFNKNSQKIYFIFKFALISSMSTIILFLPYWKGIQTFSGLSEVVKVESHLASPLVLFFYSIYKTLGFNNWHFAGYLSSILISIISEILLLIILVVTKINYRKFLLIAALALSIFFAGGLSWLMPWYMTILLFYLAVLYKESAKNYYIYLIFLLNFYQWFYYFRMS